MDRSTHARGAQRWSRLLATLLVPLMVLAACGGDDGATNDSTPGDGGAVDEPKGQAAIDPEGVLRLSADLVGAGGLSLDPVDPITPTNFWVHYMIYDTLLRQQEDGTYQPGLAESATITDPQTIEVVLQEGVTFSDGEPFTADAVKQSIERTIASENSGGHRMSELTTISEIEVVDDLNLVIRLSTPTAGSFFNLLAHNETLVVSPKALADGVDLATNPVGAGPFVVTSYTPEGSIVLEKNESFFQADDIDLAGVEILHVVGPAATVNALRSGTIDASTATLETRRQVEGTDLETRAVPGETSFNGFLHCRAGNPALQDVRVRQALNYATDAGAVNNLMYGGDGELMSQFFPSDSPFHNPELDGVYTHDVDRAVELLEEAGHEDLTLKVNVPAQGGATTVVAEMLQQQWAEAGITLELVPSTDVITDFFINGDQDLYLNPSTRTWTDKLTRVFVEGSVGANCIPTEPEFLELVTELRGLDPQDEAAVELWHEINAILHDGAYTLFMVMGTVDNIWNGDRLGNVKWRRDQVGFAYPDVFEVHIKAS